MSKSVKTKTIKNKIELNIIQYKDYTNKIRC